MNYFNIMVDIRPLSGELQKIAKEELNEVENRIADDLQHIKDWIKKQPHLNAEIGDQWLVTFLRGCKYSLEKTKSKLELYYTLKTAMPEWFKDRYPFSPAIKELLKTNTVMELPHDNILQPALCLLRWEACTSEVCTLMDMIKYLFMVLEIYFREHDSMMVRGVEVICDYTLFSLNFALQLTPTILKKTLLCVEKAYPIRVKGVHIFNTPSIFEKIYLMGDLIMNAKLKKRVHLYSRDNINEFYKRIPRRLMPKEYGGENLSLTELAVPVNKKIESYGKWFLENEKYCSIEALRPPNLNSPSSVLGIDGSFRKLNID